MATSAREPRVTGEVDLAHSARTERRNDLIGAKSSTGRRGAIGRALWQRERLATEDWPFADKTSDAPFPRVQSPA